MKKGTIAKRLEKAKVNKTTSAYHLLAVWLKNPFSPVIRPCWTSGKGKFCKNLNHTQDLCNLLELLRVRYELSNDAPRGGKTGNYIRIIL